MKMIRHLHALSSSWLEEEWPPLANCTGSSSSSPSGACSSNNAIQFSTKGRQQLHFAVFATLRTLQ